MSIRDLKHVRRYLIELADEYEADLPLQGSGYEDGWARGAVAGLETAIDYIDCMIAETREHRRNKLLHCPDAPSRVQLRERASEN